jgi:RNA polymerase sigma factor (sigma-70 family)
MRRPDRGQGSLERAKIMEPVIELEPLEDCLARLRPRLKHILKSYNIPLQEAEDILQEALLDAVVKWQTIRNVEPWLIGTLRFKCARYWRRQRTERVHAVAPQVLEELCEPLPPAQERDEVLLDLRRLARGLGRRHRAALWLRFGLGLSPDEVARRLGYSPGSIRKLTGRSMARLQRWAIE